LRGMQHQAVEAPQERSERFTGSSGRKDERALAPGNHGPTRSLWRGGRIEHGLKPLRGYGMKAGEWIVSR